MVCSRGGRHLFWFRGVCATAASSRCLAGRSDRGRPPLFPWNRGDGGRPQRVSSEARPARPSHSFRASTRREHRRAQGIWAGIDAAARPSGRRQFAARLVQTPARPAAAVKAAKRFCLLLRTHVASGGAVSREPLQAISKLSTMGSRHRHLLQKTLKNTDISHNRLLQWDDCAGRRSALATVPRVL